jgi:hypothetical protein
MSPKLLQRIALALGILLIVWGALAYLRQRRGDDAGRLPVPEVATAAVDGIAFRQGTDSIVLVRQGERWSVNGFPASTRAVETFLGALGDSTFRSELIARSPASHQRLGVDSAGRRLTITSGGRAALDLRVGNRGPDFEGFYVRPEGSEAAYLLQGQFAEFTARGITDWRDKQVAAVVPDSVAKVEVVRGRSRWSMTREGAAWKLRGRPADSTKVARFLAHFDDLRATGFPETQDMDAIGFEPPDRAVALFTSAGRPLLALVFDSTHAGAFWVRAASGGPVYRLDGRNAELATPEENTLTTSSTTLSSPPPHP